MGIAFLLVGGVSGFIAAVVSLILGHGMWQAFITYWQVGISAVISLIIVHLIMTIFRICGLKMDIYSGLNAKGNAYEFGALKSSTVKQTGLEPDQR